MRLILTFDLERGISKLISNKLMFFKEMKAKIKIVTILFTKKKKKQSFCVRVKRMLITIVFDNQQGSGQLLVDSWVP